MLWEIEVAGRILRVEEIKAAERSTSEKRGRHHIMNPSEIKEFWDANGYYHAQGVFSPSEVKDLETDFDRIVTKLNAGEGETNARWQGPEMERMGAVQTQIMHTHNVQQYSAAWHRALMHEGFLNAASALVGPDIVLHHSKLFQKPPEKGAPFPMHQDWTYFPTVLDTMMAGVIHVSDATDEMGCLRVYPGTHKMGRVEGTSGQVASEVLDHYPLDNGTIVEAKAGDVVFFHYFTLHGSRPNTSAQNRKTVLAQLYAGDDRVEEGNGHPDERLVLKGWSASATRARSGQSK